MEPITVASRARFSESLLIHGPMDGTPVSIATNTLGGVVLEVITERVGGLDVHKKSVMCAVRKPDNEGKRIEHIRQFSTFTHDLQAMARWMLGHGVTTIAMEATGVYWVPVWRILEEFDFDQIILTNPGDIKRAPGRKTDVKDASWIAQLLECGLVPPSFVPPREIFELRQLTRYRKKLINSRSAETLRAQKLLEDAGIKLDSVISNINGVSGRQMLGALIAGERDVNVLAEMSHGKMRNKRDDIKLAVVGRFGDHHAKLLALHLQRIDEMTSMIDTLDGSIIEATDEFAVQMKLLMTIPGVGQRTAEVIVAEVGIDMSQFPTAGHLASWAGMCPGNNESAGKQRSGRPHKGNPHVRVALCEAAWAASRTKDTYLSAQFRRLVKRFGKKSEKKAAFAVAHSMLESMWHMMSNGEPYVDLGADHFKARVDTEAAMKRKVKELEALGYVVNVAKGAA
jgi:transposase